MHTLLLAMTLAAPANLPSNHAPGVVEHSGPDARLATFAPLAGAWTTGGDEPPMHETWMPAHGTNLTGMLRWCDAEGGIRMYELMTITAERDAVRLRIRHFDGGMTPWSSEAEGPVVARLTESADARHVFTIEPEGGAMRTITYDLSGDARMVVTLGFAPGREPIVIEFERAD